MLRVLIADDEVRICQLIQALGDWERLGLEVAGVARIVETVLVGPFDSPAHRMRLVGKTPGGYSLEGSPDDDDPPFG